ncbi:EamA domain-containing membrane protein RarD [Salinihabitans flavidus]|uniref:EamA domain-containing membrane protein RarD n=1 Tax=Salinihabitans flavidus TaxID=569882 RepID=A0A1H8LJ72_9RHOB|nr:DMT family transporter [Salinihabitans flavidus]SEO05262.1 EamA domain-containing membrane protein RarD [Salinihabitans flavidus]
MNRLQSVVRRPMSASIGLVMGGALWGLIWLPLRALGAFGLDGAWPGIMIYGATALLLLPLAWVRRHSILKHWQGLALCGFFAGMAFSLYTTSLMFTEVVRAILLFYLTPVWATAMGIALLGERMTLERALALVLGLVGLLVVLGTGGGIPWPRNIGDWMALMSGLAWAYGSLQLYKLGSTVPVPEQVVAFIFGSLTVTLLTLVVGGAAMGQPVSFGQFLEATPWSLLIAVYVIPMLFLTIWPATLLSPGRVGILLMSEVLIGVVSAALWSGEPFGWREGIGSLLIVGAGFVEVMGHRTPKPI